MFLRQLIGPSTILDLSNLFSGACCNNNTSKKLTLGDSVDQSLGSCREKSSNAAHVGDRPWLLSHVFVPFPLSLEVSFFTYSEQQQRVRTKRVS